MAKFYVGQRVKKVRGVRNIGYEGTVVGLGSFPAGEKSGDGYTKTATDIVVQYEKDWISLSGTIRPASVVAYGKQEHYEPLVPPHEAGSWEEIEKLLPNIREKAFA